MNGQYITVRNYARTRKVQPQLVHYYIKRGQIESLECPCCGSKVIRPEQADKVMGKTNV